MSIRWPALRRTPFVLGAWWTRLLAIVVVVAGVVGVWASPAAAHPLGNFTTNRFARIVVGSELIRIHYVLDEAELVAFRERPEIEANGEAAFAASRAAEIGSNLRLALDDRDVADLRVADTKLTQPAGQGGLTTLRLEVLFEAPLSGASTLSFEDRNHPDRIGWREVVIASSAGARLASTDVPTTSVSDALRTYPENPSAPLNVRSASARFVAGSGADGAATLDTLSTGASVGRSGDRFVNLLERTTSSPLAIGGALLVALAFGAVHAVGPGHGKTVMAAYLVSTQGRKRDAVALGTVVSLMHTVSVLVLATLLATVGKNIDAGRLYPVLTVVAGVLVVGVGGRLLVRRLRTRAAASALAPWAPVAREAVARHGGGVAVLDHQPADGLREHDHDHDHDHQHDHHGHGGHVHGPGTHTHDLPEDVRPLSRAGLVALGTSGGLFPSPSAVVVLVGAFTIGRAALGLALIVAFSIGLATVLVAVGLLLVAGRQRINESRFAMQLPWLPIAGATAITFLGLVLIVQGVAQLR